MYDCRCARTALGACMCVCVRPTWTNMEAEGKTNHKAIEPRDRGQMMKNHKGLMILSYP